LKDRPTEDHDRIARLKAHVFEGQAQVAETGAAWARAELTLLRDTIDLAVGQTRLESRPVQFGRQAGITEFGHIGVEAPDVAEMQQFWCRNFTMKVSD
jgi:hypothetical protein